MWYGTDGGVEMWLDAFTEMRKKSGMSIDEISAKSGVPKGTLSKISAGITKAPPLETMRKLVYAMGYTLDDLDENISTKKSPNTAEAAPGEDVAQIFDYLNDGLVSLGLIRDGEDITDQQAEVLLGICSILRATFEDKQ